LKWWLGAAVTAWVLCWLACPLLRRFGVIDRPNERSSHTEPTIRGGGMGIVASWILCALWAWPLLMQTVALARLLGLALVLAVVSFADDVRPVPAFVRLAIHALLAATGIAALGLGGLPPVVLLVAFLWVCGYTNAFNFMDGINGLAALQAVITGLGTCLIALRAGATMVDPVVWLGLVVSGSAAGFLPHNFPRARMFMGDVSSAALGFLLAALALWLAHNHGWSLLLPLGLLHANFVLDTGLTLLRRIARGEKWHESHREHFYQRLVRAGWSHSRVSLLEAGLQVGVVALAVCTVEATAGQRGVAVGVVLALWLAFFAMAERAFRRAKQ